VGEPSFQNDEHTFRLEFDHDGPRTSLPAMDYDPDDEDASEQAEGSPARSSQPSSIQAPSSPDTVTRQLTEIEAAAPNRAPRRKKLKLTRKGNTIPSLPSSLVKRVAIDSMTRMGKKRPTIYRESLAALEQATDWFFEQMGEDLEAYSDHAKRKKRIDDADAITLMKRQRVIGRHQSLEDLAQEFLPDEVLLDMQLPEDS
jgi:histone H3/H4